MTSMRRVLLIVSLLLALSTTAIAAGTPEPLGDVVNDYAGVLDEPTENTIATVGEGLYADQQVSLIVVVISKMDSYDELEQIDFVPFTTEWVSHWELESEAHNDRAAFLFVSTGDRTARVALGQGYTNVKELDIQMIMVDHLVPHLKQDRWNDGVLETVVALAELIRLHPPVEVKSDAAKTDKAESPQPAVP